MANARSHTNRTKDLDKGDLRDSVKEFLTVTGSRRPRPQQPNATKRDVGRRLHSVHSDGWQPKRVLPVPPWQKARGSPTPLVHPENKPEPTVHVAVHPQIRVHPFLLSRSPRHGNVILRLKSTLGRLLRIEAVVVFQPHQPDPSIAMHTLAQFDLQAFSYICWQDERGIGPKDTSSEEFKLRPAIWDNRLDPHATPSQDLPQANDEDRPPLAPSPCQPPRIRTLKSRILPLGVCPSNLSKLTATANQHRTAGTAPGNQFITHPLAPGPRWCLTQSSLLRVYLNTRLQSSTFVWYIPSKRRSNLFNRTPSSYPPRPLSRLPSTRPVT
ncbi:hypothetical protein FA13DRAFT_1869018 [Coprinellus micaceus]|uniref:Uncharacterized protein n=1 Tax=Coprinellus micaceus TaxID=71717 RepID=A0A4Y7TX91_COPMI|nr:hypothetical protein FA13DRAFT_1869018 [Coprinellus micaceus]